MTALAQERPSRALTQKLEAPEWGFGLLYPEGWQASRPFANALRLTAPTPAGVRVKGRIVVTTEKRLGPEDAVERLGQVATEWPNRPQLPRHRRLARPAAPAAGRAGSCPARWPLRRGGRPMSPTFCGSPQRSPPAARWCGSKARWEPRRRRRTRCRGGSDRARRELHDERRPRGGTGRHRAHQHGVAARTLAAFAGPATDCLPRCGAARGAKRFAVGPTRCPRYVPMGGSEISVAVSTSGQHVVVATNSGYSVSSNGGVTFGPRRTVPVGTLTAGYNGDPSLALGQSGSFYYALIGFPSNAQNSTAISEIDRQRPELHVPRQRRRVPEPGARPRTRASASRTRSTSPPIAGTPPWAATRSTPPGGTSTTPTRIPPSFARRTAATNWTAPINVGTGVKPRLTVGQDGFVYVGLASGGAT